MKSLGSSSNSCTEASVRTEAAPTKGNAKPAANTPPPTANIKNESSAASSSRGEERETLELADFDIVPSLRHGASNETERLGNTFDMQAKIFVRTNTWFHSVFVPIWKILK